ncbi:DUF732 domain-containing protein [Mycolicibacter kumamotonensis]|uniref:DUF732 domain-containing protein n=1 Tax=Mycolicibacter kumamotonensis TaxID=354243 RepID=UPI0009FD61F2|nr:DUF732 domain-containing protein [Mycolicibacter kumamotonensis]
MTRLPGFALIGAVLLSPLVAPTADAHADNSADTTYLQTLDSNKIGYRSREYAITLGHQLCRNIDSGFAIAEIVQRMVHSTLDAQASTVIITAAISAYCPQYGVLLHPESKQSSQPPPGKRAKGTGVIV